MVRHSGRTKGSPFAKGEPLYHPVRFTIHPAPADFEGAGNSPSHGLRRASPLRTRGPRVEVRCGNPGPLVMRGPERMRRKAGAGKPRLSLLPCVSVGAGVVHRLQKILYLVIAIFNIETF